MTGQRFRLEFIVKAKDWQTVADIFKEELGIDSGKQDASDREINGVFIVQVWIDEDKLDGDFYSKISESSKIALSYDPSSRRIRNAILDSVCMVERDLRKLLLNISDVVEDYFKIYDKTNVARIYKKGSRDVVRKGDVNPITSHLTLEDEIGIFSIELSPWKSKTLSADEMMELFNISDDLQEIKNALRQKITSYTVWNAVDEHILKTGKRWEDILPILNEIKDIRNKAAHFRAVTHSDLDRVKSLSLKLKDIIVPKRQSTQQDLRELQRSINKRIQPIAESALAAQKAILESLQLNSSLLGSVKVSEAMTKHFFENSNLNAAIKAQMAAFTALPEMSLPATNLPQSALESMARAQRSLNGLGASPYTDDDKGDDSGQVDNRAADGKDERPSKNPQTDDTEGEKK